MEARLAQTRVGSPQHARHAIRLRRRFETVQLRDSIPKVVFLNSHDGTSAYQLRSGLFRVVCTNGLIVSRGAFPGVCLPHRGDIVDEVIAGALRVAEQFDSLADHVMEARMFRLDEQLKFARLTLAALSGLVEALMRAAQLLSCRRCEDAVDELWSTLIRVQLCGASHNCTYVDRTLMWSSGDKWPL